MPIYDYQCSECGPFTLDRTISQREKPAFCPDCGANAARLYLAPNLSLMPSHTRQAWMRNEKSRHEPSVRTKHSCSTSCGCSPRKKDTHRSRAFGEVKLPKKKNARPWMLGH